MKTLALLTVSLLCASCVTSGDLQRITDSMAEYERTASPAAMDKLQADVAAVSNDVEDRTYDWMEVLAGLAGTMVGGGAIASRMVNRSRDAARVKRGEAV